MTIIAEYIWTDGFDPTRTLRSKTKIIPELDADTDITVADLPEWQFDGSSTNRIPSR